MQRAETVSVAFILFDLNRVKWINKGQRKFADHVTKVYMSGWGSITFAKPDGFPDGIPPHQQAKESSHRVMELPQHAGTRNSFDTFVSSSMPNLCKWGIGVYEKNQGVFERQVQDQLSNILLKPIPTDMINKAALILNKHYARDQCYIFSTIGRDSAKFAGHTMSLFVSARSRLDLNKGLTEEDVLTFIAAMDFENYSLTSPGDLVNRFFGEKMREKSDEELADALTCMHEVIKNANTGEPGRQWLYRCKCPEFRFTAYICSHVLVALTLDRDVDFDAIQHADAVYTDKVGPGRKPKDATKNLQRACYGPPQVGAATSISVGESIECGRSDSRS